jgi:hypothetical protein
MPENINTDDLANRKQEIIDEIDDGLNNTLIARSTLIDLIDEFYEICEVEGYCSDFDYGDTLIHEDNFQDYIEELIADAYHEVYEIVEKSSWPVITIDYEESANQAKMDYTEVTYLGETYLCR